MFKADGNRFNSSDSKVLRLNATEIKTISEIERFKSNGHYVSG